MVPVRRFLPAIPLAWPRVEAASAVGLEHGRSGASCPAGNSRLSTGPRRAAQRCYRADLQEISRTALPIDAVPVRRGERDMRNRCADHSRALATLS